MIILFCLCNFSQYISKPIVDNMIDNTLIISENKCKQNCIIYWRYVIQRNKINEQKKIAIEIFTHFRCIKNAFKTGKTNYDVIQSNMETATELYQR